MTTGYVVIGAGYGDEGKGLMTDYLVRKYGAEYVVRFNGGAQAGHTVQTPEGKRHVFGHVGAGTFAGAKTILGPRFIINPLILRNEAAALGDDFIAPIPFDTAPISTIYDMILNAAVENARGDRRHGSCGVGINETVTRHVQYPLTIRQSYNRTTFHKIRTEYFDKRHEQLGRPALTDEMKLILDIDPDIHYRNMKEFANRFMDMSIQDQGDLSNQNVVVFEGAQGLALDEELGQFPHMTRSLTGLPQAIEAAAKLNVRRLIPVYVTRAYKTRHGAGPLYQEGAPFSKNWVNTDATNVDNPFQGSIRFAPLQTDEISVLIGHDQIRCNTLALMMGVKIEKPLLAVTCLDQVDRDLVILTDAMGPVYFNSPDRAYIPQAIADYTGVNLGFASFGPTFKDVFSATEL